MNTNPQQYPTQFYGRTWIFRMVALSFGPLGFVWSSIGLLFFFGIEEPFIEGRAAHEAGIDFVFAGLLFLVPAGICAVQMYLRKIPILVICKEGLWIRAIGTPICLNRIRKVRLRWEHVDVIPRQMGLDIAGVIDKKIQSDFDETSFERYAVSYGLLHSFGESIAAVNESVQFFLHNPDAREFLPSWQDEETLLGNDTFDFR